MGTQVIGAQLKAFGVRLHQRCTRLDVGIHAETVAKCMAIGWNVSVTDRSVLLQSFRPGKAVLPWQLSIYIPFFFSLLEVFVPQPSCLAHHRKKKIEREKEH